MPRSSLPNNVGFTQQNISVFSRTFRSEICVYQASHMGGALCNPNVDSLVVYTCFDPIPKKKSSCKVTVIDVP